MLKSLVSLRDGFEPTYDERPTVLGDAESKSRVSSAMDSSRPWGRKLRGSLMKMRKRIGPTKEGRTTP